MPFVFVAAGKLEFLGDGLVILVTNPFAIFVGTAIDASAAIYFWFGLWEIVTHRLVVTEAAFPEAGGFVQPTGGITECNKFLTPVQELVSHGNIENNDFHV